MQERNQKIQDCTKYLPIELNNSKVLNDNEDTDKNEIDLEEFEYNTINICKKSYSHFAYFGIR